MTSPSKKPNHTTGELHPRNAHRAGYDFARLVRDSPELKGFVRQHPLAGETIDFSDPRAVIALNRALLKSHYGLARWDLPPGYLCPPIPSRADYLHYVADLLAEASGGEIPRGPAVRVLDIGTGANAIYPLLGAQAYGWSFVGTELDPQALEWARGLITGTPGLSEKIEFRPQVQAEAIFKNVVRPAERFALSICNPPFHHSAEEADAAAQRKLKNLKGKSPVEKVLNFGGRSHELWTQGGEVFFVRRLVQESVVQPERCVWFTTLVSKQASLPDVERELGRARPIEVRTIKMFAGQKQSRILAWTFLSPEQRRTRLLQR